MSSQRLKYRIKTLADLPIQVTQILAQKDIDMCQKVTGGQFRVVLLISILMQAWTFARCEAQLFGARSVGRPLSGSSKGEMSSDAGTLQGGERFLRGNRSAGDFVGVDARDRARFIGQIIAQNQLAISDALASRTPRLDRTAQINSPLKSRAANSLGEPVLQLGFEIAPESTARLAEQAQIRIGRALDARFGNQIAVSVAGRTAILRGEVDDAEDARLAQMMVSLEPGISKVQNELTRREATARPVESDSTERPIQRP